MALRINLNAGVRFVDVLAAFAQQAKPLDYLYRELQFGLRAAVGTRTLDELLEDKGRSTAPSPSISVHARVAPEWKSQASG